MSFLGFRERSELRRTVARGIRNGQLPQSASIVLYNPDAFAELEQQVYGQAQTELAAGPTPAPGAPAHPILNWIVTHAPQILSFVLAILPLFGVSVPPIAIPGLPPVVPVHIPAPTPAPPPTPAPTPTPSAGSGVDPTQPIPHSSEFNPTQPGYAGMPTDFAIPALVTALTPLAEQIAAQVLATVLPTIEVKIEGWIKSHLKAA